MSTFIHTTHALALIEEGIAWFTTAWATMQEVTFMAAIIYALNTIVHLAGKTYAAGKAVGRVYFKYLHKHVRWLVIQLVVLTILLCQLAWEGAVYVYQNRNDIRISCVNAWHQVERAFIYESPKLT